MTEIPSESDATTKPLPPEFFKLSAYQKIHLGITFFGVLVAILALIRVGNQVDNLSAQTEQQTIAINLQKHAVELQNELLGTQRIATEAHVWQTIATQQIELSKIMISNSELRPYFSDGKPITRADKNYNRVMAIAEMYLDFFDGFDDKYVRSLEGMKDNERYWVLWERYFQDSFASSQALCTRFSQLKDWYTKGVGKYANEGCKKTAAQTSNRVRTGF